MVDHEVANEEERRMSGWTEKDRFIRSKTKKKRGREKRKCDNLMKINLLRHLKTFH